MHVPSTRAFVKTCVDHHHATYEYRKPSGLEFMKLTKHVMLQFFSRLTWQNVKPPSMSAVQRALIVVLGCVAKAEGNNSRLTD